MYLEWPMYQYYTGMRKDTWSLILQPLLSHRTKHSLNFDVNPYTFIENICQHRLVLRLVLGVSEKASYFKPQFEELSPLVQVKTT